MIFPSHNDEHLESCKARAIAAIAEWRADHPGQPFTLEQLVADITEDNRCVFVLMHSAEGAELYLRNTFEEWRFDYDAFSRRDWSAAIKAAVLGAQG